MKKITKIFMVASLMTAGMAVGSNGALAHKRYEDDHNGYKHARKHDKQHHYKESHHKAHKKVHKKAHKKAKRHGKRHAKFHAKQHAKQHAKSWHRKHSYKHNHKNKHRYSHKHHYKHAYVSHRHKARQRPVVYVNPYDYYPGMFPPYVTVIFTKPYGYGHYKKHKRHGNHARYY